MIDITPLVRLYARFRLRQLARQRPADVQRKQLAYLLKQARATRFGRDHDFAHIQGVEAYQQRVPLRTYDDHWEEYWRADFPILDNVTWPGKIPFFATTTGTGQLTRADADKVQQTKNIPVSWAIVRSHKRGSYDMFCHHLVNYPKSHLLAGKGAMTSAFTPIRALADGVYASFMTALLLGKAMPPWVRPFYVDIRDLHELPEMHAKLKGLATRVWQQNVRAVSGTPLHLLNLFQYVQQQQGRSGAFLLKEALPRVDLIVHAGTSMKPYQQQFERLLAGSDCDLREIYPSCEGFFGIADRGPGEGLRLVCDNQIFYEFIPVTELGKANPQVLWIDTVETDVDYALVISTAAGLWRYVLGDLVRFVDLQPPRLLISGRTAQSIGIVGERLLEADVNQALNAAAARCGVAITEYALNPRSATQIGERNRYHYLIEFTQLPTTEQQAAFVAALEENLCQQNLNYAAAYRTGVLERPALYIAPPGSFDAWLIKHNKLEGKVPRIWLETQPFLDLLTEIQQHDV